MTDLQIPSNLQYAKSYDPAGFLYSLPDMTFELDADGNITYYNRAALTDLGYTDDDIRQGITVFDILASNERDRLGQLLMDALNLRGQKMAEFTAQRKNGTTFPVNLYAFPLEKNGAINGMRCIAHDITIRKGYKQRYALKIKQLNVIRSIAKMRTHNYIPLNKRLQDIVNIIPSGWQHHNSACARISIEDHEYRTENFRVTPWCQRQFFKTGDGQPDGVIEVYYLEEKPKSENGPFLLEEQYLLDDIAERLEIIMRREGMSSELRRLSAAIENTIDGIAIANADRRFRYTNSAFAQMLGYTVDEIVGLSIKDLLSEDEDEQIKSTIARMEVEEVGHTEAVLNYKHKDGRQIPIFLTTTLVNMDEEGTCEYVFITRDMSQRIRMHEQLQRSEEMLRHMFESVVDGIIVTDLDDKIIEANDSAIKMFGYQDKNEIIGIKPVELIDRSDRKKVIDNLSKRLTQGLDKAVEYTVLKKDGTRFPVQLNRRMLRDSSGEVVGLVSIVRDITLEKRLRENLQGIINEVIKAQEAERKRIARELHDETIQSLMSLLLDFHSCAKKVSVLPDDVLEQVDQMRSKTERIIGEVRRFTHELRPAVLDKFGLIPALELLTDQLREGMGIDVIVEITGPERRLKPETELALFRITQEALNNIRRHSNATVASVNLDFRSKRVVLTINDNGCGFKLLEGIGDLARIGKLGVVGMYERAQLIGANFVVKSVTGSGTQIIITVTE